MGLPSHTDKICEVIPWLRPDQELPVLEKSFEQGQCTVYKIRLENGRRLAVRVPLELGNGPTGPVRIVCQERHVLRQLAEKGFSWAPGFYGYSQSCANPIESPFIVVDWIEGSSLHWGDGSLARATQASILDQLATIHRRLIMLTCQDASTAVITHPTPPVQEMWPAFPQATNNGLLETFLQTSPISKLLDEQKPPKLLAMDHGDLQPSNIIINNKYEIQGIVGWDSAALVPFLKANDFPAFLREPATTPEEAGAREAYRQYYRIQRGLRVEVLRLPKR